MLDIYKGKITLKYVSSTCSTGIGLRRGSPG